MFNDVMAIDDIIRILSKQQIQILITDLEKYLNSGYMPLWFCELLNNESTKQESKENLLLVVMWYIIKKLKEK